MPCLKVQVASQARNDARTVSCRWRQRSLLHCLVNVKFVFLNYK
jgi:hypothetical protein